MGFLDWFRREKKITDYAPEELKREEARLQIRENQTIARLENVEAQRELFFRQGSAMKAPVRRRILARKYEEREQEVRRLERELARLSKESMTVAAIRYRLERRSDEGSPVLKKIGGSQIEELRTMFEDDQISEELYSERLEEMLGAAEDPDEDPVRGLGSGARSVLDIWDRIDEGAIEDVDEGLREARDRSEEERLSESE